jgi:hypothetical protein
MAPMSLPTTRPPLGEPPRSLCYLILQRAASLLLPVLCNSMLLAAHNSRQVSDLTMVSSGSPRTLIE